MHSTVGQTLGRQSAWCLNLRNYLEASIKPHGNCNTCRIAAQDDQLWKRLCYQKFSPPRSAPCRNWKALYRYSDHIMLPCYANAKLYEMSLVHAAARPCCLQVQPQLVASSNFPDKADKAAILHAKSGQHSHQCPCLCLKEGMQLEAECSLLQTYMSSNCRT